MNNYAADYINTMNEITDVLVASGKQLLKKLSRK